MIIRSQNKKCLVNLDNIDMIGTHNGEVRCFNGKSDALIGKYTTEEKAVKVLDMICEFANGIHFEKVATERCGKLDGVVFNMPQDSEV